MSCKLCGSKVCHHHSRSEHMCTGCHAKYIAFQLGKEEGSLCKNWAYSETKSLEAEIGRAIFQPEFEANHNLDGLSTEDLFIVRIRALRLYVNAMNKCETIEE